ncbi:MAG: BACON domain-containing protein [Chloroflexi bacterium]|nr:BACON domain-containing protein [Chloroflexota bacterium]
MALGNNSLIWGLAVALIASYFPASPVSSSPSEEHVPGIMWPDPQPVAPVPRPPAEAAQACVYSISSTSQSFPASGGSGSVSVTTGSQCAWTAWSTVDWVVISSGSGIGNGVVAFSVAANNASYTRSVWLTIAGQAFLVNQAMACLPALYPTSQSFSGNGGSGSVLVTIGSECSWTVVNDVDWIAITSLDFLESTHPPGSTGIGNGTVHYYVAPNPFESPRTRMITIANVAFTISQGSPCRYSISPTSQSFPRSGGTGSVNVTALAGCAWTAVSDVAWVTITSGGSAAGNGQVTFKVAANTGASSRTGALTIAGKAFTVSQEAACVYSISPTSETFPVSGGTSSVNVTAGVGCAWTAASGVGWVVITSGGTGTGNGTVAFRVTANDTSSSRSGTLTIAGQTFTVSQGLACLPTIFIPRQSFPAGGGMGGVNVTAPSECTWMVESNADWVVISSGGRGTGSGTVGFTVAANNTFSPRTATLTVAGQTFTVQQEAPPCSYAISPTGQSFPASGGTGSASVTAGSGCSWTAVSNVDWVVITSGAGGVGDGTVGFTVAANNATSPRTGALVIAGQTFTVSEAPSLGSAIQISLVVGWNLISAPSALPDPSIGAALAQTPEVTRVHSFQNGAWVYASRGEEGWSGALSQIVDGNGYWLYATAASTLVLSRAAADPPGPLPSYSLAAGWNLIGFTSSTPTLPVDSYLSPLAGKWTSLYRYVQGKGWEVAKPGALGFGEVQAGVGYWVYLRQTGTLAP